MLLRVDHVAVLVRSMDAALATLPTGVLRDVVEEFDGEGTRECYVRGPGTDCAALLLMEAIGPGPYQRSLVKRGPGLHHIGVTVRDLAALALPFTDFGMRLHPHSLESFPHGTVWACGGGLPFLLEVHQREAAATAPFIEHIELSGMDAPVLERLLPGLFASGNTDLLFRFSGGAFWRAPLD